MKLGCIGDDFTGSSDLANTLAKGGMRVTQYTGVPSGNAASDVEAGVVALKSRSIHVAQAVEQSLAALDWLLTQGCTQIFFKYCSTFDSTPEGNIGQVMDALAARLKATGVIACPAFPTTGRSVYQGHLFVQDQLLSDSSMRHHPLTPMTDPDLRRWLGLQTQHSVGHVAATTVFAGPDAILAELDAQHALGHTHIIVDAIRDEDLMAIGKAAANLQLITGGSGVALGLPANFGCSPSRPDWTAQSGKCVALSGSCSVATREQVAHHEKNHPSLEIIAADVIEGRHTAEDIASWALQADGIPLVYSSADPVVIKSIQNEYGLERSSRAIETLFSDVAALLVAAGVTRLLTAGGETSGAVVESLKLKQLEIGPEIDPGVPALRASKHLTLALKSGNFGAPDFFEKAASILGDPA